MRTTSLLQQLFRQPALLVVFIFVVLVVVRLPQLTRPLSKHHELNSAAVLICVAEWNRSSPAHQHFLPKQYFSGPGNVFYEPRPEVRGIANSGGYFSMGPGSYLLPWAIFKVLRIPPASYAINFFNILLEALAVLLFYRLALLFFRLRPVAPVGRDTVAASHATFAAILYMFLPVTLWYHGNAYCHEVAVLPFVSAMVYAAAKLLWVRSQNRVLWHVVFFIATVAGVLCDWYAGLVAAVIFCIILTNKKRELLKHGWLLAACVAGVVLPVVFVLWQYSEVIGWQELRYFFANSARRRAAAADSRGVLEKGPLAWLFFMAAGFGAGWLLLVIAFFTPKNSPAKPQKLIVGALLVPAVLHTALLFNFANEHDYSALKWMPALVLLAGAGLHGMAPGRRTVWLVTACVLNLVLYEWMNRPGQTSVRGDRYDLFKVTGDAVKKAPPGYFIFVEGSAFYHQLSWYAGRNYMPVASRAQADSVLKQQPAGSKSMYFKAVNR